MATVTKKRKVSKVEGIFKVIRETENGKNSLHVSGILSYKFYYAKDL
jgi:hypothetical protein